MDGQIAMCELRDVKQRAYESVCCDFALNHNMEGIAKRIGMSGTMLRNKLNPAQPHKMDPVDLALLSKESGDFTILNTLFADMGVVTVAIPKESDAKNFIERTLMNNALSGELSSDAMSMCSTERLPRSKKRKTLAKAQAALGNLALMISDLENRTTGMSPLLSMGTDFLVNGMPLPGLS
ncbi:phage regulatory CII family protein [Vibrio sp.]|uniref:Transcriptional regulator n=1 Tax=Vibrio viridaestus TaxID=2487322 RepID=A0A3N9TIH3_9VIBR|nr:phage regulatory CII family protein [Vibrio viridaestus]MDC0611922.1 phage regulatory CII family protein [Vibrio sp.]RQW64009.1 transcriptional regulator [Vibrio viridaestus]